MPTVGDTYNFTVTYSDGSQDTGSTVNGKVTAFGSTGAIVGASDLATNLSPNATSTTSVTPTFTWTYPTGASTAGYIYSFYISTNTGNTIWQIPSNNSNFNGFTYSQDPTGTLVWGTDPIPGDSSSPTGNLNTSTRTTGKFRFRTATATRRKRKPGTSHKHQRILLIQGAANCKIGCPLFFPVRDVDLAAFQLRFHRAGWP